MSRPLSTAGRAVEPAAAPLAVGTLRAIALGIGEAVPLWRAVGRADPAERRSVRLLATEAYEVWVLAWAPGQAAELHDHGPSEGMLLVVDGELDEVVLEGEHLTSHPLRRGEERPLSPRLVHGVANIGDRPATSIHVYSPPLTEMGRWDPETLEREAVERVVEEVPALPAGVAAALLHPSARRSVGA